MKLHNLILSTALLVLTPTVAFSEAEAPAKEETKKKGDAVKATLTGTFKKMKDGRVVLTTEDGTRYVVVKSKIEQVGDHFDKNVTAICKTKPNKAKPGLPDLIVQINKITPKEDQ